MFITGSSNGRTFASEAMYLGSNPSPVARIKLVWKGEKFWSAARSKQGRQFYFSVLRFLCLTSFIS